MELLNTVKRKAPLDGAFFSRKNPNTPESSYKRMVTKFKADTSSEYYIILLDALSTSILLETELSYSSQVNKARAEVLKMRIGTLLNYLLKYTLPVKADKKMSAHIQEAVELYNIMSIRATKNMKQDFFNNLASAKKLL